MIFTSNGDQARHLTISYNFASKYSTIAHTASAELTPQCIMSRIEAVSQSKEKCPPGQHPRINSHRLELLHQCSLLVCRGKNINTPAVEESLQASQGCLFSFPDHKEPHSPIDVEEACVGLTVHRANSDGDRVDRLVTQSIAIPSLTCLPGQAPPSRELEPTV